MHKTEIRNIVFTAQLVFIFFPCLEMLMMLTRMDKVCCASINQPVKMYWTSIQPSALLPGPKSQVIVNYLGYGRKNVMGETGVMG